jgi:hypothetical protein
LDHYIKLHTNCNEKPLYTFHLPHIRSFWTHFCALQKWVAQYVQRRLLYNKKGFAKIYHSIKGYIRSNFKVNPLLNFLWQTNIYLYRDSSDITIFVPKGIVLLQKSYYTGTDLILKLQFMTFGFSKYLFLLIFTKFQGWFEKYNFGIYIILMVS